MKLWKNPQPTYTEWTRTSDTATLPAPWVEASPEEVAWWESENQPMPEPVPQELTRRQFFLAIYQKFGLTREQLRAMLPDSETARIDFDEALYFRRDNALLLQMATALGKTPQQVDEGFILGATFE